MCKGQADHWHIENSDSTDVTHTSVESFFFASWGPRCSGQHGLSGHRRQEWTLSQYQSCRAEETSPKSCWSRGWNMYLWLYLGGNKMDGKAPFFPGKIQSSRLEAWERWKLVAPTYRTRYKEKRPGCIRRETKSGELSKQKGKRSASWERVTVWDYVSGDDWERWQLSCRKSKSPQNYN